MIDSPIAGELERRAPGAWELYRKRAESHEVISSGRSRRVALRSEEGWAARWWERGAPGFAAGSNEAELARAIREAGETPAAPEDVPAFPASSSSPLPDPAPAPAPPDVHDELARLVAADSRGEAVLAEVSVRLGERVERVVNAKGGDVSVRSAALEGVARAVGRREGRACEARAVFRWDGEPELGPLSRRLSDRATFPLSERSAPMAHGEWLLDPSVAAALLAAAAPLFTADSLPPWVQRGQLFSEKVGIVDDAGADSAFDGEGTATRRVVLVDSGALRARLHDLRSARAAGTSSTGHGVRSSYRTPPAVSPRRLFVETGRGASARDLLAAVRRGLFASALTAPVAFDLERDRYEVEFTGIAILAGRAQGPVAGARARGRISQLFRRIAGVSTDRQFFVRPYPVGSPTLLVERADFD